MSDQEAASTNTITPKRPEEKKKKEDADYETNYEGNYHKEKRNKEDADYETDNEGTYLEQ